MVAEAVPPGPGRTDTVGKLAEYAYEGIAVNLVIHLDGEMYVKTTREYPLDWARRTCRLAGTHDGELALEVPFPSRSSSASWTAGPRVSRPCQLP